MIHQSYHRPRDYFNDFRLVNRSTENISKRSYSAIHFLCHFHIFRLISPGVHFTKRRFHFSHINVVFAWRVIDMLFCSTSQWKSSSMKADGDDDVEWNPGCFLRRQNPQSRRTQSIINKSPNDSHKLRSPKFKVATDERKPIGGFVNFRRQYNHCI